MDHADFQPENDSNEMEGDETRRAPRFKLLIRAAKLVTPHGEFVCVLRDVSTTGISIKLFHGLPEGEAIVLELQCGNRFSIRRKWVKDSEAGFEFIDAVDVDRFITEVCDYPKRAMRLGLQFPARLRAVSGFADAFVENISQQGARITCSQMFAIDQTVRVEAEGLPEVRAKVRWRNGGQYGLVFDDTFTLRDLAILAAQMQCPKLLRN